MTPATLALTLAVGAFSDAALPDLPAERPQRRRNRAVSAPAADTRPVWERRGRHRPTALARRRGLDPVAVQRAEEVTTRGHGESVTPADRNFQTAELPE